MKLIRAITSPALPRTGCVLTIGNFDALHIGHRKMLQTLTAKSKQLNLPSVVMTFDPHPQAYFRADFPIARLTTTATRFFALRECGVDVMLSLKFNHDLAHTSAERFIQYYLAEQLRVKYMLVGDDFRFGSKRVGDFNMLEHNATQYGYEVERFDTIERHDNRISSTWIRELLSAGDLEQAELLLGRKYVHVGRVVHGDKRGREWGFPTVNMPIRHEMALSGIFAVRVAGLAEVALAGVASLGKRPSITSEDAPKTVLEVYLFDYDGDAYGKRICVEFVKKIRDEEKFDDLDALKAKIADDVRVAKTLLKV